MAVINLTTTADVTLKTAGKYCEDDIQIVQNLEEVSATPTDSVQEFIPSDGKNGISKFIVTKTPTEQVSVKSTEQAKTISPSSGKFIDEVSVEPIVLQTKTVVPTKSTQNISADAGYDGLKTMTIEPIPDEYIIPSGSLEVIENGIYDVTEKSSVNVNVASTGTNGLQWKCDNMKTLANEFHNYTGTSLDEPLNGLDTSNVTITSSMFQNCDNIESVPLFDTSNVTDTSKMFYGCDALTSVPLFDISSAVNTSGMFQACTKLTSVPVFDMSSVTNANYMFGGCDKLTSVSLSNTSKITNASFMFYSDEMLTSISLDNMNSVINTTNMFSGCSSLESLPEFDLSKATSIKNICQGCSALKEFIHPETPTRTSTMTVDNAFKSCTALESVELDVRNTSGLSSMFYNNTNLTNLTLKNISTAIKIGSGTAWGHLLTLDSLINTIKELWDYSSSTSTKTLTMGTANLEKIANVYVKLIDVTDEMLAEDQYADQKKPCVVCESTDEGAMTITEYATSKGWSIA